MSDEPKPIEPLAHNDSKFDDDDSNHVLLDEEHNSTSDDSKDVEAIMVEEHTTLCCAIDSVESIALHSFDAIESMVIHCAINDINVATTNPNDTDAPVVNVVRQPVASPSHNAGRNVTGVCR
jgi:hypothetical protein